MSADKYDPLPMTEEEIRAMQKRGQEQKDYTGILCRMAGNIAGGMLADSNHHYTNVAIANTSYRIAKMIHALAMADKEKSNDPR